MKKKLAILSLIVFYASSVIALEPLRKNILTWKMASPFQGYDPVAYFTKN